MMHLDLPTPPPSLPALWHIISNHWIFSSRFSLFLVFQKSFRIHTLHLNLLLFSGSVCWRTVSVAHNGCGMHRTSQFIDVFSYVIIYYYRMMCVLALCKHFYGFLHALHALFLLSLKEMFSILYLRCCCRRVVLLLWLVFSFSHWLLLLPFHSIRIN